VALSKSVEKKKVSDELKTKMKEAIEKFKERFKTQPI